MRLFGGLAPLVGLAVANPLAELQARQLNPSQSTSCSIPHTRSCSNTALQSSARAFCGSLGYGTTISTIRTTATVRQTTVYTVTSTTRIATVTAPVLNNTATSVRTSMTTLTSTTTDTRIATEVLTVNTFGLISACSGYTPEITAQNPEIPGANDVPTDTSSTTTTTTTRTTTQH
ncbi:unnamed protein product [Cercospora beticola]|nr:unnamed protein product [Cercospora beticola]